MPRSDTATALLNGDFSKIAAQRSKYFGHRIAAKDARRGNPADENPGWAHREV
jgi:hypothetical protein